MKNLCVLVCSYNLKVSATNLRQVYATVSMLTCISYKTGLMGPMPFPHNLVHTNLEDNKKKCTFAQKVAHTMLVKTFSASLQGLLAAAVTIEVNATHGVRFAFVWLLDNAVKESNERILAAIENSGYCSFDRGDWAERGI